MEQTKPLTPAEAFSKFFENTSFTDMLWLLIASVVGYLLILIAQRQYRRNSYTAFDLAVWFVSSGMSFILTYADYSYHINQGGSSAWGIYGLCFIVAFLVVYALNRELYKFQRLVTTLIIGTVGLCLFWSFITGEQAFVYAIMSGVFQGGSVQLFLITLFRYYKRVNEGRATEEDKSKKKGGKI